MSIIQDGKLMPIGIPIKKDDNKYAKERRDHIIIGLQNLSPENLGELVQFLEKKIESLAADIEADSY